MRLTVNGSEEQYDGITSVTDLLGVLQILNERVAVMVNDAVVKRADLERTELHDGDRIEVITMVGGG